MTSKEALSNLYEFALSSEPMETIIKDFKDIVLKDLEVLEILKKTGAIDLLFGEEPYCNYRFTDVDMSNVIDVDYDDRAPDLDISTKDLKTIREWLNERNN